MKTVISFLILAGFVWMMINIIRNGRKDLDETYRLYGGYKGYKNFLAASVGLKIKLNAPDFGSRSKSYSVPHEYTSPSLFRQIDGGRSGLFNNNDSSLFFNNDDLFSDDDSPSVNPANGLPMVGGVDIEGNAYGSSGNDWGGHYDSWNNF